MHLTECEAEEEVTVTICKRKLKEDVGEWQKWTSVLEYRAEKNKRVDAQKVDTCSTKAPLQT